ncbi:MAG: glycosyltransferase family 4 protein [Bacilli bacterium]
MKILLNNFIKDGATPTLTLGMAKGFLENGHDVYLVLSKYTANKEEYIRIFGLDKICFVDTHSSKKELLKKTLTFLFDKNLKLLYKNNTFDICISIMYHSWNTVFQKKIDAKKKYLIVHDPIPHSGVSFLKRIKYIKAYKKAENVIVLSKKFVDVMVEKYKFNKNNVIHINLGKNDIKHGDIRDAIPMDGNKTNFLFFGYISKYKGLGVLAEAFRKLKMEKDDVALYIVGSGNFEEYRNKYEGMKNVYITNRYIENEEICNFFNGKNVVVVAPYTDATQSGIVAIALDFKKPIIITDTGGLTEQLDDGKVGLVCKPGDANDLYEKMLMIAENKEVYQQQEKLMEKYSKSIEWNYICNDFIAKVGDL